MKLIVRLLLCLLCILSAEDTYAATQATPAYRVDYIDETILLRKDTTVVVVNLDLEWPKRLCGSQMPVLQTYLCKQVFGSKASTMEEGKKEFLESLGQRLEMMPDDPHLYKCFLYVKLKELAWERDNWISFRLVIVGRDAKNPQFVPVKSLLFTYDIVREKVLTTDDLIKSSNQIGGLDHDYTLDVFDEYYPSIEQSAEGWRLPDQTCLLTSDLGVAFNLTGTDAGDGMEYLIVVPNGSARELLTRSAKKMMDTPARDRWKEFRKRKDLDFKADSTAADNDMTFPMPDVMPQFRGGEKHYSEYLSQEVKFPVYESLLQLEGKALVSFIVDKTGKVHSPSVVMPSSPGFDREAVRVVMAMPNWIPATRGGEPVDMRMTIPVKFILKRE